MRWRAAAFVAVLGAAVFLPSLRGGFVYDDHSVVEENPWIRDLARVPALFGMPYWATANPSRAARESGLYRPLTLASFSLNYAAGGLDPRAYRLANLLLHAATCVLVLLLAGSLGLPPQAALFSAAAFAVLPVHAEAVCWIVGRSELLAAAFSLAAWLLAFKERRPARLAAAGACFVAALLSKENVVGLPLVLALSEGTAFPSWREAVRRRWPVWAGAAVILGLYLEWRYLILGSVAAVGPAYFAGTGAFARVLTMGRFFILGYLWPLASGLGLRVDYARPSFLDATPAELGAWAGLLGLLALLTWLGWLTARRRSKPAVAFLAFFVLLAPVSNILFPTGVLGAERFLYLPSAGFCLAAGWVFQRAAGRHLSNTNGRGRRAAAVTALALLGWWGVLALARSRVWVSDETFWTAAAAESPGSTKTLIGLGSVLDRQGRHAEARASYLKALELVPGLAAAHYQIGASYYAEGNLDEAESSFQDVVRRFGEEKDSMIFLGLIAERKGRLAVAEKAYRLALSLSPLDAGARRNLGLVLHKQGRVSEARAELAAYVQRAPPGPERAEIEAFLLSEVPDVKRGARR